jgi:hypothetical protein
MGRWTHERLVSSQSFPHLWKKLWKFLRISGKAQRFTQFSACFVEAKVVMPSNSAGFLRFFRREAQMTSIFLGRKCPLARFSE